MSEKIVFEKSTDFAIRIINLYKYLADTKKEFVMSKQLLRSGTSIGANIREATYAQSRKDFLSKMNIALKEVAETEYWLDLLSKTDFISNCQSESIKSDCLHLKRLLHSIVKTTKATL